MRNLFLPVIMVAGLAAFVGCTATTPALPVVASLDLKRYLGTWYEIAKLPNRFESGLTCVTANYELKENGDIKVTNAGYKVDEPNVRKSATGTAWVVDPAEPAKLKVRFFWPFAGAYWVIALDPDYKYAMVGEPARDYLWILAREKTLPKETISTLLSKAQSLGFDSSKVEMMPQDCK
ncbi:MAG: lipocalin family protein [Bacteroidetes bacterium]|nr:lipocalin family protein [Bacteroidota bacterium]